MNHNKTHKFTQKVRELVTKKLSLNQFAANQPHLMMTFEKLTRWQIS